MHTKCFPFHQSTFAFFSVYLINKITYKTPKYRTLSHLTVTVVVSVCPIEGMPSVWSNKERSMMIGFISAMFQSSVPKILLFAVVPFVLFVCPIDGQALNDPSTQYIEGRLANRRIWWCPSGYGYLAYCPQPTDWDNYNWCCTFPYFGSWKPSCCPFAIPTGAVIAVIIAAIILVAVLVGLSCWCCYFCPLYKQLYENDDEEEERGAEEEQGQ